MGGERRRPVTFPPVLKELNIIWRGEERKFLGELSTCPAGWSSERIGGKGLGGKRITVQLLTLSDRKGLKTEVEMSELTVEDAPKAMGQSAARWKLMGEDFLRKQGISTEKGKRGHHPWVWKGSRRDPAEVLWGERQECFWILTSRLPASSFPGVTSSILFSPQPKTPCRPEPAYYYPTSRALFIRLTTNILESCCLLTPLWKELAPNLLCERALCNCEQP